MKIVAYTLPAVCAASLLSCLSVATAETAPTQHIRGTLTSVSPGQLTIATSGGSVTVAVDAKTKVVGVVPATAAEITSGTFIGTANVPGVGSMSARALEVVVFPKSMAGTGEGDYPWDLAAGKMHSTMTNGTVAPKRAGSMMTNATVTGVAGGAAKIVTLQFKGGSKSVMIAPGTPVVRAVPGSVKLLVNGAHVVAFPARAGAAVPAVVVGEQGAVPPM